MIPFHEAMKRAAAEHSATSPKTRAGTISAYNPSTYAVKVIFQPSGVESGWLPIKTHWVGNGWGMQAGPTIGDLVAVTFQEGGHDAGVVIGSLFNNVDQPMAVPSGEMWIKHASGSLLRFHNDGSVEVVANTKVNVTAGTDANVTVGGNATMAVTGAVSITGASIALNAAGGIALNGPLTQGLGTNAGGAHLKGPLQVDGEVTAVTTPLHTHQHVNGGGVGNSGNPTP